MKRVVAIDFGLKRCGLALSNGNLALPWMTVDPRSVIPTIQKRKDEITTIIIGLPLLMNGTKADMAKTVEAFAKELESALQIPVIFVDERLSSKHAESALRETGQNRKSRTEKTDEIAATLLLQSFLERQKNNYSILGSQG